MKGLPVGPYEATLLMRLVESTLHPDGLSTTTRAVLARIRGQGGRA